MTFVAKSDNPNFKEHKPKLHEGRLLPLESAYATYHVELPYGTTPGVILDPTYWVHHTKVLKPGDYIVMREETLAWGNIFTVAYVSAEGVKLQKFPFDNTDIEISDAEVSDGIHHIVWQGPAHKFAIVHRETKEVIKSGLYPKHEALTYLARHMKRMEQKT